MNCLEYRRQLTAEPGIESATAQAHREQCEACTHFTRSLRTQEAALLNGLNISVPDTLAAKVLFRQRMTESRHAQLEAQLAQAVRVEAPATLTERIIDTVKTREASNVTPLKPPMGITVIQFALAASIAIAVAAGALLALNQPDDRLVVQAIAHVDHERWMFERDEPLPMNEVRPVLRMVGMDMTELPGEVTQVFPCPWYNKRNFHFVMTGTHDKVTVMVLPGKHVDEHQSAIDSRYAAVVIPVRHGSLAVVGHPQENLHAHAEQVRKVLRWRL